MCRAFRWTRSARKPSPSAASGWASPGLADALIFCRTRYGSPESVALIQSWLSTLSHAAYRASVELAREKGAFPLFDAARISRPAAYPGAAATISAPASRSMASATRLLTSIAPTGTISLFAGNVSSGIEPVFAFSYNRKVLQPDGSKREETVEDYAVARIPRAVRRRTPRCPIISSTPRHLTPDDHLAVQAAAQPFIDSAISKTINVPASISFEAFKDVYLKAYENGCKGCTTYRPNDVTGAVLSIEEPQPRSRPKRRSCSDEPELPLPLPAPREVRGGVVYMTRPLDRPDALLGRTYKIKWLESDHAFYITINDIEKDGRRRPFEVFINSKNMEAYAWALALTRMISAVFRRGGDVSFVVDELKAIFDPRGGQWMGGRYVPSLLAAIGEVIERHMIEIGFLDARAMRARARRAGHRVPREGAPAHFCPRCGEASFVKLEGCDSCLSCGYSKCG